MIRERLTQNPEPAFVEQVTELLKFTSPRLLELVNIGLLEHGFVNDQGIPLGGRLTIHGVITLYSNLPFGLSTLLNDPNYQPIIPPGYSIEIIQTTEDLLRGLGQAVPKLNDEALIISFSGRHPAIREVIQSLDGKRRGNSAVTHCIFGPPPVLHLVPKIDVGNFGITA